MNFVWKCWRDTWPVCAVAMALPMLMATLAACDDSGYAPMNDLWRMRMPLTVVCLTLGLFLGARMAGRQFGREVAHFIYTRPERRSTMLWKAWGVSVAELLASTMLTMLYCWAAFRLRARGGGLDDALDGASILQIVTLGLLLLSVTYALTAATQKEDRGVGLTMLLGLCCVVLGEGLRARAGWGLPLSGKEIGGPPLGFSLLLRLALGAAFVWAAQFVIERREA